MEVNPVNTPQGAVVLIVDGLSAPFIYPELTPYSLDGAILKKAELENLPKMSKESARILELRAPQTFTEGGHSVLVTGNPGANSELVSFKDATIFDILHREGYLCIGVMERGDSWSICAEQDVILRDKNNSIKNIEMVIEQ
ncbi:MAG: phosphoglycerate mutase, partial [Methanosarcina sp.]|nr:phosphoglycerate mutase [Methanosarcina sp.]